MRTRLAGVQLCVHTNDRTVGRTLTLSPGLNLVHGGNSRGRAHLVSAVISSLGLERMLTARARAPLGMAFSGPVRLGRDGVEVVRPVTSSWVAAVVDLGDGRSLQPTFPPPAFDRLDRA